VDGDGTYYCKIVIFLDLRAVRLANPKTVTISDDGPQSPAECSHLLCHNNGGGVENPFLFTSCSWDGEVIATAEPSQDQTYTTVTSDPHVMCVTCTNNPHLNSIVWQNLPVRSYRSDTFSICALPSR